MPRRPTSILSMCYALLALVVLVTLQACSPARRSVKTGPGESAARFQRFSDDYLAWYLRTHPVRATELGVHDHDGNFPDLDRKAVGRAVTELHAWHKRLAEIPRGRLAGDAIHDHLILERAIAAELLELDEVGRWKHDPMLYNRLIANGIAAIIDRDFAPLDVRLESLIGRMRQIPRVTRAAQENLVDVPRLWAELALRNTQGTIRFLREDVVEALESQGLRDLAPEQILRWEQSHAITLQRMERFAGWLRDDLLPRADGDFRLGRELFEKKLLLEEHIEIDADALRAMNESEIHDYHEWVSREAARIDPKAAPAEVMRGVTSDHPAPDELIPTARRFVEDAREFTVRRGIVSLPTDALPIIRPTPDYARSGFASMSTPGPFETQATEAYYNITNVDPEWDKEKQSQHMTYFNYPGLLGISVHEVMPGHYVQLLYRGRIPTDVRKVFMPSSLIEGWAHYCEQMMIDEGLGDGDPAIRLGQLRRALQRHARWYAGLEMHAFGESVDNAASRFQEIAYFAEFPALRETQRGTYDPTYLYYALGRMEIFRLREDYRRHRESRGETFSLREFHDRLLSLGLPIPLAREIMIPNDG